MIEKQITCPRCKRVFKADEKDLQSGGFEIEVKWINEYGHCLERCEDDILNEEIPLDKIENI